MRPIPTLKLVAFTVVSIVLMSACKKYEEGPAVSLRSKKERIANTWRFAEVLDDGRDVSGDFDQYELTLTKDGDASLLAEFTIGNVDFNVESNGTWSFIDDKEGLDLDLENDDADATYLILRLKEDELWLREQGDDLEFHLVPK